MLEIRLVFADCCHAMLSSFMLHGMFLPYKAILYKIGPGLQKSEVGKAVQGQSHTRVYLMSTL
jgi:hypothetical protein